MNGRLYILCGMWKSTTAIGGGSSGFPPPLPPVGDPPCLDSRRPGVQGRGRRHGCRLSSGQEGPSATLGCTRERPGRAGGEPARGWAGQRQQPEWCPLGGWGARGDGWWRPAAQGPVPAAAGRDGLLGARYPGLQTTRSRKGTTATTGLRGGGPVRRVATTRRTRTPPPRAPLRLLPPPAAPAGGERRGRRDLRRGRAWRRASLVELVGSC